MDVQIVVADAADAGALEGLDEWLRGEPSLRGHVRLIRTPPAEGQMGALAEALTVAVSTGGAITVLASALRTWIEQPRHSAVQLRIRIHADGAREIDLDADRIKGQEVEAVLERALAASGG